MSNSATATTQGFDFQCNAALVLMLKNITNAAKVKVEGQSEDVEVTFADGTMLMAQAKYVVDPDNFSNVIAKLGKALGTLDAASKNKRVNQLIYATNSPNPFNKTETMYRFSSPQNLIPFSDLPEVCKDKINELYGVRGLNFNRETLKIFVMQFSGEDLEERYKVVKQQVSDFLGSLQLPSTLVSDVTKIWQDMFHKNSTQGTTEITKVGMVWPIIAFLCKSDERAPALSECDENDAREILQYYGQVIDNNIERFEFVTKVLSDYGAFHSELSSSERTKRFISEKWQVYTNDMDLQSADEGVQEMVLRLTLGKLLSNRQYLRTIKEKVNL